MGMRWLGWGWCVLLIGWGAVAGAAPAAPSAPRQQLTLVLDWFVNPNHAPLVIAAAEGIFARHGLDVRIIAPADPNDAPRLVAAGKADLGVGYQTQLHLQVAERLPVVRVGALIDRPLNILLVLESSGIRRIADLRGKKIGYSVGGVEEAVLQTVLNRHGLGLRDVRLVHLNYALTPALLTGQVDAVVGAYRNVELPQLALMQRPGRAFPLEDEGVPMRDALIFIAHPDRLNPSAVAAFLRAVGEAVARIRHDPDTAFAVFAKAYPEADTALNRVAWDMTLPCFATDPAALDPVRYRRVPEFLHAHGLIPAVLPVARYAVMVKPNP